MPDIRRYRVTAFAVGLVAGVLSALLGIGGGLIMVPAMALLLNIRQHRAVATSLAVIIPTALAAALRYEHETAGRLQIAVIAFLALGGVVGGVVGALAANALRGRQLRRLFGVLVIGVGVFVLGSRLLAPDPPRAAPLDAAHALVITGVGLAVGTLSGLMGVGGGLVMVPALLLLGYDQHLAQGTSLAVIVPVSLSGTLIHVRKGNVIWSFALWLSAGAVLGAWLTAGGVFRIPDPVLRVIFGVFTLLVGLSMIRGRAAPAASAAPPARAA
jgi:hypothetical protein